MSLANNLIKKGYLISPSLLKENLDESVISRIENLKEKPLVINKDIYKIFKDENFSFDINISWKEFDKSKVNCEKNRNFEDYRVFLDILNYKDEKNKIKAKNIIKQVSKPEKIELEKEIIEPNLIIVKNYEENIKKRDVQDFVDRKSVV